jgi:hypothetical protein
MLVSDKALIISRMTLAAMDVEIDPSLYPDDEARAHGSVIDSSLDDLICIVGSKLREKDMSRRIWTEVAVPLCTAARPYMVYCMVFVSIIVALLIVNVGLLWTLLRKGALARSAPGLFSPQSK